MAILRSKEIWDMEVDEIQDKLVEKSVMYVGFLKNFVSVKK